jgi:hypothetical protein
MTIRDVFDDDNEPTYPGSTSLKRSAGGTGPVIPDTEPEPWEEMGKQYRMDGRVVVLYSIGAVASALGRAAMTIRHWDQKQLIPTPEIRTDSSSHHGRKRIYTHEQVAGLRRIAVEEGLLKEKRVFMKRTRFTERAFALFRELEK